MKLVISTIPQSEAGELGATLVKEKYIAGVNIIPAVRSIYTWKGALCDHAEAVMLMMTTVEKVPGLMKRISELHSYEVPEIISIDIDEAGTLPDYLKWVIDSVAAE